MLLIKTLRYVVEWKLFCSKVTVCFSLNCNYLLSHCLQCIFFYFSTVPFSFSLRKKDLETIISIFMTWQNNYDRELLLCCVVLRGNLFQLWDTKRRNLKRVRRYIHVALQKKASKCRGTCYILTPNLFNLKQNRKQD